MTDGAGNFSFERPASLTAQIAAGVALGIIVAVLVIWQIYEWRLRVAASEAAAAFQAAAAESARRSQLQAQQLAAADQARRRAQALADASAQRTSEMARRAVFEDQNRKDRAWSKFYKKPRACDETAGGSWTVDCANDFIRAKRRFEEQYKAER